MEDFRMKLQSAKAELLTKVNKGEALTPEEIKVLFLQTYLSEEENERK